MASKSTLMWVQRLVWICISGGLLAFTLSIDDFVITFFVAGPGSSTLPLKVYSMIKHSPKLPVINCLSTVMLLLTFVLVLASRALQNIKRQKEIQQA